MGLQLLLLLLPLLLLPGLLLRLAQRLLVGAVAVAVAAGRRLRLLLDLALLDLLFLLLVLLLLLQLRLVGIVAVLDLGLLGGPDGDLAVGEGVLRGSHCVGKCRRLVWHREKTDDKVLAVAAGRGGPRRWAAGSGRDGKIWRWHKFYLIDKPRRRGEWPVPGLGPWPSTRIGAG